MENKIEIIVYISTGRKGAQYTLRVRRSAPVSVDFRETDYYIRNLGIDPVKAEQKAKEYFNRVYKERGAIFVGYANFELNPYGMSPKKQWEQDCIESIESDIWPFGKYKGESITNSPDGYVHFWAKLKQNDDLTIPALALATRCHEIAESRGLFAAEQARLAEIEAKKAKSDFIGTEGDRIRFTVNVEKIINTYNRYDEEMRIVIMRDDEGNKVTYFGFSLNCDENDRIAFDARIKRHDEYKGEKGTIINRPTKFEILN